MKTYENPNFTGYRLEVYLLSDRGKRRNYYFYEHTEDAICGVARALLELHPEVWHIYSLTIIYFKNGERQKI